MKVYQSVPTVQQWRKDMGLTGIIKLTDFPALQRITELLGFYHQPANHRFGALKHELLCQIFRHCEYIIKNSNNESKLGTSLWKSRLEAVVALKARLTLLKIDTGSLDVEFGQDVCSSGQIEDQHALASHGIQWYQDKASRDQLKLSFRSGLAHRWQFGDQGEKQCLLTYDTDRFCDAIEAEMSLYVMDTGGRIFCSGHDGLQSLKHSSFLAGGRTLAAGTMRVENGRVVWITGKSGHYRPEVQQMLNLLERLRAYQVDLSGVTVFRENYRGNKYATYRPRHFEPCPALELLNRRSWPGELPFAMRVA